MNSPACPKPIGWRATYPIWICITRGICPWSRPSNWRKRVKPLRWRLTRASTIPKAVLFPRKESIFVYGNSLGFIAGYPTSRHSISCAVIAESDAGMQRDYWYTTARQASALERAESVGRITGSARYAG